MTRSAVLALLGGLGVWAGCSRDTTLGLADGFAVFEPRSGEASGAAKGAGPALLAVAPVEPTDPRAEPLFRQFSVGFAAEVLRTDYLAKQLVRDLVVGGRQYDAPSRAAATQPTVFVVGAPRGPKDGPGRGLALEGSFGRTREYPDAYWVGLALYPHHDLALPQTLAGLIGTAAATRVAGDAAHPVVVGYARALEVIAREWRVGEGPAGAMPANAGTPQQRELFAAIRENRYTLGPDGAPRAARELLADPNVAATVLYRLAQSKSVGRKVAPAEVYAPFVKDRVPDGVSPAAVLGPFRNFQAKLLSAWGRAVLEGRPPRDIADLVDAYARALPAERSEIVRIFVVTTFGATVRAGGIAERDAAKALPELTALAAEVAAGRLASRAALVP